LAVFIVFSILAVYHLANFIPPSSMAFFTTYIFLAGVALVLFVSWRELQGVDWTQALSFFSNSYESLY